MTSAEPIRCRNCGAPLPRAAALGLCPACVWQELDASADESEFALPGLKIVGELARGGMGVVYRAVEAEAGREVAVKMLRPALADEPGMRERFKQEARAIGALDHPGILPVYRIGEHDGLPYFTMKLALGGSLAERRTALTGRWREIAALLADVADAVHHAHQHGLLHRDLKPGNILFDESGRAYVSDFGLVKIAGTDSTLTHTISVLGTPHYMAPEVASHDARAASVASDVWGLGAILYELLADRLPFDADGIPALLRKIVEDAPAALSTVPRDLAIIALHSLAKEPGARYASAAAFASDLRAWLKGHPITARSATIAERAAAWIRRNPALALLSTSLVLAIAFGVISTWRNNRALDRALTAALAQAQANRHIGRPGQRQQTLDALAQIAALRPTPEVREQAITTLALPDVRELGRVPYVAGRAPLVDGDFQRTLALEPDGRIRIRDLRTNAEIAVMPELDEKIVEAAAFSPDGQIALCRTKDQALHAWHVDRAEWLGHYATGTRLPVFSPDSTRLAFGHGDSGQVLVHDLTKPADAPPIATLAMEAKGIAPLAWSPDGRRLALGRAEGRQHEIQIVDAANGTRERVLPHPTTTRINRVSWLPDGSGLAVTGGWFDAYVWRFDLPPPQWAELRGHSLIAQAVACSPQGGLIATTGRDWTVRIWDAATRETVLTLAGVGETLAFSRDGRKLLYEHSGLGQLVVCEVTPSDVCRQIRTAVPMNSGDIYGAYAADFSPDGRQLAVADWGGVYFFDAESGTPTGRLACGYANTTAYVSVDTLSVGGVGFLGRWKIEAAAPRNVWTAAVDHPAPKFYRLAHSDDRQLLAIAERSAVYLFRGDDPRPAQALAAPPGVEFNPLALSPDGRTLVVSGANRPGVWVWDTSTGSVRAELPAARQYAYACFSTDGRSFWVHDANALREFDTSNLALRRTLPRIDPGSGNSLVARSGDGRRLGAALDATSVSLLDAATGRALVRLAHPRPRHIQWMAFDHDASRLAVCVGGHVVQLWDLKALRARLGPLGLDWEEP